MQTWMPLEALLRTGSQGASSWDTNDAYASRDVLTGKLLPASIPSRQHRGKKKNKNRPNRLLNHGPSCIDRARFKMKRGTE